MKSEPMRFEHRLWDWSRPKVELPWDSHAIFKAVDQRAYCGDLLEGLEAMSKLSLGRGPNFERI